MSFPKLRFKNFDGDWKQIRISDYSDTVTSGSRDWAQYYSDKGDKFIRMTNLVRDGIYLDLSDLRFVDLPKDSNEGKRTSLQSGDILISITAELGKLGWVQDDLGTAYINQHTALVRMSEKVDSKFIAYTLSTEKYNNKLNNLNDSGAKAGLNLGTIRSFELTIPQKIEQTEITSFLSAVDEKISQLTQKHQLLSQYKQGMMQKLFSQQIRFKADDGSEFGEWELLTIQDLVDREVIEKPMDGNHGEIHPTSKDYVDEGIPFIMATDVINGKVHLQNSKKITKQQADSLRKGFSIAGDILLTHKATIGNIAIVPSLEVEYIMLTPQVTYYRVINSKKLSNQFLKVYFEAPQFQKSLLDLCTGATRLYIGISEQRKLPISLPSLEEQTQIANFLLSIDQKIAVVAQQIEQAKIWKKGLLQQMFV